ncbi:hypothetical protein N1851_003059 [Merluccius polli]|uniref:Uncharacterized protein n=1 Tax=Merluccius polli TaxID=89951 RepID=A0AA47NAK3_MERPO|nr:hypothetical protein N1851_003059 [Merluccius polli]
MGHDIRVHRDFYRQTDKTFQIAKISKLLFAMEEGTGLVKGKNLDNISLSVSGEREEKRKEQRRRRRREDREGKREGGKERGENKGEGEGKREGKG